MKLDWRPHLPRGLLGKNRTSVTNVRSVGTGSTSEEIGFSGIVARLNALLIRTRFLGGVANCILHAVIGHVTTLWARR